MLIHTFTRYGEYSQISWANSERPLGLAETRRDNNVTTISRTALAAVLAA